MTMKNIISVYDDEGQLEAVKITDFDSEQEAAISVIERLIEWSEQDGPDLYSSKEVSGHIQELEDLKEDVKTGVINLDSNDWFSTCLGFTFSTTEH
ncbi:hypothetical protein BKG02_004755 [Vibrio parahaemolyticus]|uniref:hypothetical protein n=1 Tax=Vibrio parahaemolyticus TaxID=670 RepID=UPI00280A3279|nr:hypothetical protein [Vibrio parahaemolyticus]EJE4644402.1 hypothetical protein [Vibrio parahaemolyticus]ELA9292946.1 hypothetical protein [Vibrio parahaemolyticus]MDS1925687.1 hypothetical protein [Vibrio parahaemolyticus]HCG8016795.1 hypothetical protein [Vibrio parahaemolyticus]